MGTNRVFLPQEALDAWLESGKVVLDGEIMTLQPEGQRFKLQSAVHIVADVGGAGDALGLVGKVKDLSQLAELSGEHCADSVIVGDDAYQVVEGFVGEPITEPLALAQSIEDTPVVSGTSLDAATRAAVGEGSDRDSGYASDLARFFLQR